MPIEMLKLHWKAAKWLLLPFIVGAFAMPFITWTGGPIAYMFGAVAQWDYLYFSRAVSGGYPFLAATSGIVLALTAWNWDHQKGHVYALSLPISRARYSMLKFGSGVVLLLIPTAVLLATATVATSLMSVPYGLHAYPGALTVRFFLSGLTAYALFFALASGTIRTTVILLAAFGSLLFLTDPTQQLLAQWFPYFEGWSITGEFLQALVSEYGPLRIFTGNWNLIDV